MRVAHMLVVVIVAAAMLANGVGSASAQSRTTEPLVQPYFQSGKLAEGDAALTEHLKANPGDDQARFGLGTLQFLRAVERLMQSLYTYGLRSGENELTEDLPFARLPTPPNANPKTMTYDALREIAATWIADLARAEAMLAQVKSTDVKLPIKFGLVRLDFNGDGTAADEETLWKIFMRVQGGGRGEIVDDDAPAGAGVRGEPDVAAKAQQFVIAFDAGDVQWLRGYCHLLSALAEIALAHDSRELFNATAHLFFQKVQTPFPYLAEGRKVADMGMGFDIADAIAFIHLIRFPVTEPKRMSAARDHLHAMLRQSRESWKLIQAETDDDREWLPNAKQATVVPNVRVTQEMIDGWLRFVDEGEALLEGKRLAPFWRGTGNRGVNLRRVFTEPTQLDLVLWIQGSAAAPYIEDGELTRPDVWRNLVQVFGGNMFGFAAWFN